MPDYSKLQKNIFKHRPEYSNIEQQKTYKRENANLKRYTTSPNSFASGAFKYAFDAVETEDDYLFEFSNSQNIQFAIITLKPEMHHLEKTFYDEIKYYYEFGELDISPKIWYVSFENNNKKYTTINLQDFFKITSKIVPKNICYIVEKLNCNKKITEYYTHNGLFNYISCFSDVRRFIETVVKQHGMFNMDIKFENMCLDKNNKPKMIDLDPRYMMKINVFPNNGTTDKEHFINYMLFQIFICLRINLQLVNILFHQTALLDMIKFFQRRPSENTIHTHPLLSLLYYTKRNEQYFDFKNELKNNAVVPQLFLKDPLEVLNLILGNNYFNPMLTESDSSQMDTSQSVTASILIIDNIPSQSLQDPEPIMWKENLNMPVFKPIVFNYKSWDGNGGKMNTKVKKNKNHKKRKTRRRKVSNR